MLRVVDFFLLSRSFAEALYRGLIGIMLGNELLHPDHIVPAAELVPALVELSHQPVSQMLVKMGAVPGQILVLYLRIADAGVQPFCRKISVFSRSG